MKRSAVLVWSKFGSIQPGAGPSSGSAYRAWAHKRRSAEPPSQMVWRAQHQRAEPVLALGGGIEPKPG